MFFSRRWRDKVEGLERDFAVLSAQRGELERALDKRLDGLLALLTEQQKSFQKLADQYTDGLQRARQTIEELDKHVQEAPVLRNQPLHMTEEEEDIEFALNSGSIDLEGYNQALRDAGLGD